MDNLTDISTRELQALRASGVDRIEGAGPAVNALARIVAEMRGVSDSYTATVKEIGERAAKKLERPEGIDKLRTEARTEADARLKDLQAQAEAATTVIRGVVSNAAMPKPDPARELLDRDEARLLLDSIGPEMLGVRITQLPDERRDHLVGILGTSWGRTYLESKGHDADALQRVLRTVVAERAAEHGHTDTQRFAGKVWHELTRGEKAWQAAFHHARMEVETLADKNGTA